MNSSHDGVSRRSALQAGVAGALGLLPGLSLAQDHYPSRPVKFVVPFGAGSSSDLVARSYAQAVTELTGQAVVVDNRGGGDGVVAARALLGLPADGYALMFASNTLLSTNAVVHRNLPYDPLNDFDPISVLQVSYAAVAVPAQSKFRNFADLAVFAAQHPGTLSHASGSATYTLWNAWLTKLLGVKTTNIPYKDSGGAAQAVASGQVDYAVTAVTPLLPLVESGHVRILLYTGHQRHIRLPNVPTAREAGLTNYQAVIWNAVAVRAGTPAAVRQRIAEIFDKVSRSDEIRSRAKAQGYAVAFSGPEEMLKLQEAEIARWRTLVADTGLRFE